MEHVHEGDKVIREWVKENILTKAKNVHFYEERFTKMDCEYTNMNDEKRYIEIKNRHFNHDKYDTTIIEQDKFMYMDDRDDCELCVLFDDGVLYYSSKDIKKNFSGFIHKFCPDQYDTKNNGWKETDKICAQFTINEDKFYPYSKFKSTPTREITKSEYYD